ncbi:hypothetical protein EMPS_00415 [Entomortierella parvispora]|uniref:Uncharacterized protein n=1 Tax=Entomortierella parvispora TaxID=205924 RepID=A0A9P3H0U4_9FUNG|nr:hypothetical protein EMPS_00415 [Entomortierella parvispora]
MSGSADVYSRISEKMRNEHFTEEEIKIVDKAKGQLSTYATTGSLLGGAGGVLIARAKNFKGLQAVAIATGGFLIGSQMGVVMGAMASVRTIQSIPNFKRVLNIVQEVRNEAAGPAGAHRQDHSASMPSAGHQRFPVQDHGQGQQFPQMPSSPQYSSQRGGSRQPSELLSDDLVQQQYGLQVAADGYHGGHDPSGSRKQGYNNSSAWAQAEQKAQEIHNNSQSWTDIRQKNMPRSAWNDVRDGRLPQDGSNGDDDEDDDNDQRTANGKKRKPLPTVTGWDRVRQLGDGEGFGGVSGIDGPSAFPRTREDLESRPSRQKNQYGDAI